MSTEAAPNESQQTIEMEMLDTANDRFKRSFGSWFWGSMVAATLVHFAVLAFWPNLEASDVAFTMDEIEAIDLPPEIEIPPPPEQIQRPAEPVITEAQIDEDITIAPTTFEDNPMDDLPPPPTEGGVDISEQPTFTPYEVAPEVLNNREVQQALEREYPSILRDAGIGGLVMMHFFIDEQGVVQNAVVAQGSGHSALDAAAERVAYSFRFSPAVNRDQQVPVWVQIPIRFETR
jgi:periplasmic protein TonB